jgi:hypothetical protein
MERAVSIDCQPCRGGYWHDNGNRYHSPARALRMAGLSGFLTGLGHGTGSGAKIRRFSAPVLARDHHPHVRVDRYHCPLVGGTMIWITFGVGAALGVGIGVAIGGCVAALIIGWWDQDADRTVRRDGSR